MTSPYHSAALCFNGTILHHWHVLTGKHYGKQTNMARLKLRCEYRGGKTEEISVTESALDTYYRMKAAGKTDAEIIAQLVPDFGASASPIAITIVDEDDAAVQIELRAER
ncbi:MAG TPA: hypothetical protein VHE82_07380 [Gemmatimonadaceae bacterium]|nr:hypothetical protein [Gemmatimonadaceae bacterium]